MLNIRARLEKKKNVSLCDFLRATVSKIRYGLYSTVLQ